MISKTSLVVFEVSVMVYFYHSFLKFSKTFWHNYGLWSTTLFFKFTGSLNFSFFYGILNGPLLFEPYRILYLNLLLGSNEQFRFCNNICMNEINIFWWIYATNSSFRLCDVITFKHFVTDSPFSKLNNLYCVYYVTSINTINNKKIIIKK